jgi:colanic acid/amylovoran biosynthesis glycosyltransferase
MNVLHFIRKKSQLKASFIKNQVNYPTDTNQFVVYRFNDGDKSETSFSDIDFKGKQLDLSAVSSKRDDIQFKLFKSITNKLVKTIKQFIDENNIDVCHFHYGSDAGIFFPLQKRLNKPMIVSFYGYDCFSFPKAYGGLGKIYLQQRVFKHASKVLAMSQEMEKDLLLLKCPKEKVLVHYHGVPNAFVEFQREYKEREKITFLMLSYLDPVKGHLFILDSLKLLIGKGITNFELIIVGEGHYRPDIEERIQRNNLADYVKMAGALKYMSEEFKHVFSTADVFLHPSVVTKEDKEGIPGAMVEAMFSGLPIIATKHGGIPYVVEDKKTGLLVEEWNTEELGKALTELINNKELRKSLGLAARVKAISDLDVVNRSEVLKQIYSGKL